jgi:hypothetical protein
MVRRMRDNEKRQRCQKKRARLALWLGNSPVLSKQPPVLDGINTSMSLWNDRECNGILFLSIGKSRLHSLYTLSLKTTIITLDKWILICYDIS